DSTSPASTPNSAAARSMPAFADWLNDLSFQPPSSETMHGLKSASTSGAPDVGVDSGAAPQPASATNSPAAAVTPRSFLVVEMVNSRLPIDRPRISRCIEKLPSVTRGLHTQEGLKSERLPRRNRAHRLQHVAASGQLQGVHDALDALGVFARGDQQRVLGVDDHDVLDPDDADDALGLADEDAAGGVGEHARVLSEDREVVLAAARVELGETGGIAHVVP